MVQIVGMALPDGRTLTITGTPARHGPVGIEPVTGIVTGFILSLDGHRDVYISGDTVWFEGLKEVAERFDVGLALLFTGATQPRGPFNVTMNSNDAVEAANCFKNAKNVSVHNFGYGLTILTPPSGAKRRFSRDDPSRSRVEAQASHDRYWNRHTLPQFQALWYAKFFWNS